MANSLDKTDLGLFLERPGIISSPRKAHRHWEHCVVEHRVKELIELTTISQIPLAKPPKHPCCKYIHNSIPLFGTLKAVNTIKRFDEPLLWL